VKGITHDPVLLAARSGGRKTCTGNRAHGGTQAGVRCIRSGAKPPWTCVQRCQAKDAGARLASVGGLPAYGHALPD